MGGGLFREGMVLHVQSFIEFMTFIEFTTFVVTQCKCSQFILHGLDPIAAVGVVVFLSSLALTAGSETPDL